MVSVTIQLQDPYLVLPENSTSSTQSTASSSSGYASNSSSSSLSSISMNQDIPHSAAAASSSNNNQQLSTTPSSGTTTLNGTIILTLDKPIKVLSLAVTLDGSSHLSLSTVIPSSPPPTHIDKRTANYSRQHIRLQQFLIEPTPDPEHHVTLVAVNTSSHGSQTASPEESTENVSTQSTPALLPNQIAYPFKINVPNNIPVSVSTPHGGTTYRLTAELTMMKSPSVIMAIFTSGANGSTVVKTTTTNLNVYRAGFQRGPANVGSISSHGSGDVNVSNGCGRDSCLSRGINLNRSTEGERAQTNSPRNRTLSNSLSNHEHLDNTANSDVEHLAEADPEIGGEENILVSDSISTTWPGHLEASITVPFIHLPLNSKLDLRLRVELTGDCYKFIKYFQVALWERVIFRVSKTYKPQHEGQRKHTVMAVVGIRERNISTQRMSTCWPKEPGHRLLEKVIRFTTPNPIHGSSESYSPRQCHPSTYNRVSKLERQNLEEDIDSPALDRSVIKLGAIDIEIQHFLRCTLAITGSKSKTAERDIGDIPVVIRGIPGSPECDCTGLPTYIGSFATSLASSKERESYEETTRSRMSSIGSADDFTRDLVASLRSAGANGDRTRDSVFSLASIMESEVLPADYENDDAFLAVMGLRGMMTPPTYEDCVSRASLDAACSELQLNSVQLNSAQGCRNSA
ncbi:hypothetical protein BGZ49_001783 [Haplosporangium sp. Z 27]|nr:hypothetical protein BGZ49_001783 [Haplosporangium sp. Z 27]